MRLLFFFPHPISLWMICLCYRHSNLVARTISFRMLHLTGSPRHSLSVFCETIVAIASCGKSKFEFRERVEVTASRAASKF